jgi:hypothetical protein
MDTGLQYTASRYKFKFSMKTIEEIKGLRQAIFARLIDKFSAAG